MNNSNGAALLARARLRDLVTVRTSNGGTITGRLSIGRSGFFLMLPGRPDLLVRPETVVKVQYRACNELGAFGASRPDRAPLARPLIARALRDLQIRIGHQAAREARYEMLFISGCFPSKRTD